MNITNTQRIMKLASNLLSNPDLISSYFKHNIWKKQFPIDLELPWWSYRAIQYVDSIVYGKMIFEYGSGGSTIHFAKHAKNIVAVEDDAKWAELVQSKLEKLNIKNVNIQYSPFDFYHPEGFEKSDYLKMVDMGNFDIIIIDGQDHSFKERLKCFRYVEPRMSTGQFIILDDFWRYEELYKSNCAKEVKVFESVGPSRFGVTSTAVFLY